MTFSINNSSQPHLTYELDFITLSVSLSYCYAVCHYAENHYAEGHYAECRYIKGYGAVQTCCSEHIIP